MGGVLSSSMSCTHMYICATTTIIRTVEYQTLKFLLLPFAVKSPPSLTPGHHRCVLQPTVLSFPG